MSILWQSNYGSTDPSKKWCINGIMNDSPKSSILEERFSFDTMAANYCAKYCKLMFFQTFLDQTIDSQHNLKYWVT